MSILPERTVSRRRRVTTEAAIKFFFSSNALMAIIVLALITIFLFREGSGFFGQNLANLRLYRRAGLEYVDIIRTQAGQHAALSRHLGDIRLLEMRAQTDSPSLPAFNQFADAFSDTGEFLNALVSDANDQAVALREALIAAGVPAAVSSAEEQRAAPAAAVDPQQAMVALRSADDKFPSVADTMKTKVENLLRAAPQLSSAKAQQSFASWQKKTRDYLDRLPATTQALRTWDPNKPVPAYRAITAFLFGTDWITASFWQDWYGIIPLLVGSIMVSVVALLHCCSARGLLGDLCKRSSRPSRENADQTVHRIYFRNSFGRARIFWHRCGGTSDPGALADAVHEMGARLSNQRTAECFYRGRASRVDGGADNFHFGGRCVTQCAARIQRSVLCAGRESPSDYRARARAGVVVRNYFGGFARTRPGDRRNDGGLALRWKSNCHSRLQSGSRRFFPTGPHHDRHHRAGNGRSGAREHSLSRAIHGRTGSLHSHSRNQLSRAKIGRAISDEHRLNETSYSYS